MKKQVAIVAILTALWLALPAAAAAPTVSLGNGVLEVSVGQIAPLPVSVADVENLYGVEIHLRFDPAVVEVADADPGTDGVQVVSGDFLSADFVAQNRADNQAGTVDYAVTQINPSEPKSGSGTLLTIRFQGVGAGRTSQLEVLDKVLTTRDGEVISATAANSQIRVKGIVAGENSPTPLPATPRPATATPNSPAGGDAPAATRAFTSSPVPAASVAAASATPDQAPIAPLHTQVGQPVVATPTGLPRILATETPADPNNATAPPSPSGAETPLPGSTTETIQPTPALVAKSPSGNPGKAILAPGDSEQPGAGEQQHKQPKQPAFTGLLIGAGVLLGLAIVLAAVMLRLALVRGRA